MRSADHMNDPEKIHALFESGVLSEGRRDALLNFPWDRDLILHEAGVPPIHTPMSTLAGLPVSCLLFILDAHPFSSINLILVNISFGFPI